MKYINIKYFDSNKEFYDCTLNKLHISPNENVIAGGTSFKDFFKYLANENKKSFCFTISDERLPLHNLDKINIYNYKKIIDKASSIKMYPDYNFMNYSRESFSSKIELHYNNISKIHYCLLGIGDDGHIAGLFNKKYIKHIVDKKKYIKFYNINDQTFRISLSYKMILSAKEIDIFISTKKKLMFFKKVFDENNQTSEDMPVLNLLKRYKNKLNLIYIKNND